MFSSRVLRSWIARSMRPLPLRASRSGQLPRRSQIRSRLEVLEDRTVPTVFTITNTLDDGSVGSLRWAVNQVNADTDPVSTIDFNIAASGTQTIYLTSALPTITHPVVIDGYSQLGSSPNTLASGENATLHIVLDGSQTTDCDGLDIAGGDSTVEGLQIKNFQDNGIELLTNGGDTVAGNVVEYSGGEFANLDAPIGYGAEIYVDNSSNNIIGGTTPAARNQLIYAEYCGIEITGSGAQANEVQGNLIGTDGCQDLAGANCEWGIFVLNASDNTIGGTVPGAGNDIAGPTYAGVEIMGYNAVSPDANAADNVVQGNLIGTNATGTATLGDTYAPVGIDGTAINTLIGGPSAAARNVIAPSYEVGGGITMDLFFNGNGQGLVLPTGTVIERNYVGVNAADTGVLGGVVAGGECGIYEVGDNTTIEYNVISIPPADGVEDGVDLYGLDPVVEGNIIYGDGGNGVGARSGWINGSGMDQIEENSIYDNVGAGVAVGWGEVDVLIEANSIYGNGNLGINNGLLIGYGNNGDNSGGFSQLFDAEPLQNVPGGLFTGPNDYSFINLTATLGASNNDIDITGALINALPDTAYYVSFGVTPLSPWSPPVLIKTDCSGTANFNLDFPSSDFSNWSASYLMTESPIIVEGGAVPAHSDQIGNYGQNYPILSSATSGSSTVVNGTLNGEANTNFTVDLYANPTADPSGYGQGEYYLGNTSVTTDTNGNASFSADLSTSSLPGGVLPSGWSVSATATDPNGNTSEFSQDLTTAPATQTFSQYLQAAVPQNASAPGVISIQVGPDQSPATVIAAVNGLTNVTQPVTIIYDLNGGTYSTGGLTVDPPPNVTFVVENGTLDPIYPALTVAGGQVSILNCTLTTSGNAPTLLVTGGNVTLLNDNVIQSSTTYTDPAISLTGGTVNLGTATTPGNDTLSIRNSGDLISNTSGNAISAVGDTFTANGTPVAVGPATQVVFTTAPSSNYAGFNLNSGTGVQVVAEDVASNVVAGNGSAVTLSITNGPAGGAFTSGSVTSVAAQNGVATFTNLAFNLSGTYTLKVTDGSLTTATATVVIQPNTGVLLLDPTSNSLNVSGNAVLNVTDNGAIVLDSSNTTAATASGNASITATEIDDTGGVSTSGNAAFHGVINKGVAVMSDPLANLAAPTQPSTQFTAVNYSGTLQPGTYVGGITVSGNNTVTLQPGIYYLKGGGLTVSGNATVTGTGVMIYITGLTGSSPTSINISGNADITLTPLTSGTYQGIVIFQDRNSNAAITISGNGTLNTTGTEYAPGAKVTLSGNDDTDNPTHTSLGSQWIVDDLTLSGNAKFAITADANNRSDDPNAFMVAGGPVSRPATPIATLTSVEAKAAVWEALALWQAAGLNAGTLNALARTTVTIEPLPAPYLGLAAPGTIYLDTTAEGYGWFTNTSPTATPPAGEIDLLTVVSHELGHLFGLMDGNGTILMAATLAPGVRILPNTSDLQALHTSLAVSSVPVSPISESSRQLVTKIAGEQEPTAFRTLLLNLPPGATGIDSLTVLPTVSSSPTGGQSVHGVNVVTIDPRKPSNREAGLLPIATVMDEERIFTTAFDPVDLGTMEL